MLLLGGIALVAALPILICVKANGVPLAFQTAHFRNGAGYSVEFARLMNRGS